MNSLELYISATAAWFIAHPVALAGLIYVILNVLRRLPPPNQEKHPVLYWAWHAFERLMCTAWDKFGGPLKMVFEPPLKSTDNDKG